MFLRQSIVKAVAQDLCLSSRDRPRAFSVQVEKFRSLAMPLVNRARWGSTNQWWALPFPARHVQLVASQGCSKTRARCATVVKATFQMWLTRRVSWRRPSIFCVFPASAWLTQRIVRSAKRGDSRFPRHYSNVRSAHLADSRACPAQLRVMRVRQIS